MWRPHPGSNWQLAWSLRHILGNVGPNSQEQGYPKYLVRKKLEVYQFGNLQCWHVSYYCTVCAVRPTAQMELRCAIVNTGQIIYICLTARVYISFWTCKKTCFKSISTVFTFVYANCHKSVSLCLPTRHLCQDITLYLPADLSVTVLLWSHLNECTLEPGRLCGKRP